MDDDLTPAENTPTTNGRATTAATPAEGGSIIIELEGLIKNHIAAIGKLQEEYRKHKEMLDDVFNNDAVYKEHAEKAKEATKIKNTTKLEILKRPDVAELNGKVKEFKSQLSENQGSLSDYLQEYARIAGVDEIEADDGTIHRIVYNARLVRTSNYKE